VIAFASMQKLHGREGGRKRAQPLPPSSPSAGPPVSNSDGG